MVNFILIISYSFLVPTNIADRKIFSGIHKDITIIIISAVISNIEDMEVIYH